MTGKYVFLEAGDVIKPGDEIYIDGSWGNAYSRPGQKWNSTMHTVRRAVK